MYRKYNNYRQYRRRKPYGILTPKLVNLGSGPRGTEGVTLQRKYAGPKISSAEYIKKAYADNPSYIPYLPKPMSDDLPYESLYTEYTNKADNTRNIMDTYFRYKNEVEELGTILSGKEKQHPNLYKYANQASIARITKKYEALVTKLTNFDTEKADLEQKKTDATNKLKEIDAQIQMLELAFSSSKDDDEKKNISAEIRRKNKSYINVAFELERVSDDLEGLNKLKDTEKNMKYNLDEVNAFYNKKQEYEALTNKFEKEKQNLIQNLNDMPEVPRVPSNYYSIHHFVSDSFLNNYQAGGPGIFSPQNPFFISSSVNNQILQSTMTGPVGPVAAVPSASASQPTPQPAQASQAVPQPALPQPALNRRRTNGT